MKKLNIYYIILFIVFIVTHTNAQERGFTYTNLLNPLVYNPSLCGNQNQIQAVLNLRGINSQVDGASRNFNMALHMPFDDNNGIGIKFINNASGAFQVSNVEAMYSRKVRFNDRHHLRLGLSAGMSQNQIRNEYFTSLVDLSDPALNNPDLNHSLFTCGAGVSYYYKQKFEAALSFPSLISGSKPLQGMFIANTAYTCNAAEKWDIRTMLNYYNFQSGIHLTDIMVQANWDKTIQFGTGYRSNGTLPIMIGFNYNSWGFKYVYYQTFGEISGWSPNQNEICLQLGFNKPGKSKSDNPEAVADEIDKLTERINSLQQVEKTNPGLIDMKRETERLSKDLNIVLSKYKITSKEQLDKVRNLQQTIESFMARYH